VIIVIGTANQVVVKCWKDLLVDIVADAAICTNQKKNNFMFCVDYDFDEAHEGGRK
jgi:hypothetical protein